MKNFGLMLVAGGAAIASLGFFMRGGEGGDDSEQGVTPVDRGKAQRSPGLPKKRPGELNVTSTARITTVTAIYP